MPLILLESAHVRIIVTTLAAMLVGFFASRGVELSLDFFVLIGGVAFMYGLIAASELLPTQDSDTGAETRLSQPHR